MTKKIVSKKVWSCPVNSETTYKTYMFGRIKVMQLHQGHSRELISSGSITYHKPFTKQLTTTIRVEEGGKRGFPLLQYFLIGFGRIS